MVNRTLKCLVLMMGVMVLLGTGGASLAVDAREAGEEPTSDQTQVPTSPNVDINTIFGMQGLNTNLAPEKGGGGGDLSFNLSDQFWSSNQWEVIKI